MCGYKAAEVASEIAVLSIIAELKEAMLYQKSGKLNLLLNKQAEAQLIIDAVKKANNAIYHVSQTQPQCAGMDATLVLGLFANNKLFVGQASDFRMYRLRQ